MYITRPTRTQLLWLLCWGIPWHYQERCGQLSLARTRKFDNHNFNFNKNNPSFLWRVLRRPANELEFFSNAWQHPACDISRGQQTNTKWIFHFYVDFNEAYNGIYVCCFLTCSMGSGGELQRALAAQMHPLTLKVLWRKNDRINALNSG